MDIRLRVELVSILCLTCLELDDRLNRISMQETNLSFLSIFFRTKWMKLFVPILGPEVHYVLTILALFNMEVISSAYSMGT